MLFTEPTFLFLFFPLLLWLYWGCPSSLRNGVLALASLIFYAWGEKEYTIIILVSILLNYLVGLAVAPQLSPTVRKTALILGVVANLGLLAFFKYANFFVDNLNALLIPLGSAPIELAPIHLPIGISFFTFQSMSYVIDVYRGHAGIQKNLLNLGLYVSLFPQLIAGPIVRYESIASQIANRFTNVILFASGVRRFIIGLGKKMIIANAVAYPADQIFSLPSDELTTSLAWLGIICYTLQIYFDFSGYSDMAIGLGRMFGFEFLENFRYPYISRSVTDFWRRWHISLSTWFRDYLYIPLGGNRISQGRTYFNLVSVFFLCGLWHGANWGFVVWGLYHGAFLVVERAGFRKILEKTIPLVQHLYAMIIVMIGWVFFRVATGPHNHENLLGYALNYCGAMLGINNGSNSPRSVAEYFNPYLLIIILIGILGATPFYQWIRSTPSQYLQKQDKPLKSKWYSIGATLMMCYLLSVLLYSILLIASDSYNPFIYFQF
ncbi:MAG: MBOAT family protein [Moorea sp. SIO2B7]|nr:MBOAT family protein [Moorena sp. SIO2B7]